MKSRTSEVPRRVRGLLCTAILCLMASHASGQAAPEAEFPAPEAEKTDPAPSPKDPSESPESSAEPSELDPASAEEGAPEPPPAATEEQDQAPEDKPTRPEPPQNLDDALQGFDGEGSPPKPAAEGEERETGLDEPLPENTKREPVDYDGRDDPQTDAGEVLRWVPRVVLFPLYVVMQYGIRVPLVWTITRVEENHLSDRVLSIFTWDQGRASLFPLVSFDFGIRPNVGLVFKWSEAIPRHDFGASLFVGPDDLWAFGGRIDQKLFRDEGVVIRWQGDYVRRPDNVFYGISNSDARCNQIDRGCRFRSAIAQASLGLVGWEHMLNEVKLVTTFRHARFDNQDSDSPPLTDEEAVAVPGFTNGYQILEPRLTFALDTRDEDLDFHTGTGLRLEGMSAFAIDVSNPDNRWFRAGGEAGAFYDLGFGQVLAASIYYEGAVNTGWSDADGARMPIPFFELPYLGGSDQMKGFYRRRLVGHNSVVLNLEYRYPITWALDAALFTNIGNTYEDLGAWDIKTNYLTYGLSLKLAYDRSLSFEGILGWGSNRLDEPSFDPFDQFRLTAGVNKGF